MAAIAILRCIPDQDKADDESGRSILEDLLVLAVDNSQICCEDGIISENFQILQDKLRIRNMSLIKVDLTGRRYRETPFCAFSELRQRGEVIRVKIPLLGKVWLATSFASVNEVLKDTATFVRQPSNAGKRFLTYFQFLMPRMFRTMANTMIQTDEPDHRRLRSLVEKAFVRSNITALEPRIREMATTQLDWAGRKGSPIELVEGFARPFPLAVICELLGLPDADRGQFMKWFEPFSNLNSFFQIFSLFGGLKKLKRYLLKRFEHVRRQPEPGLITALVEAEENGDRLTEDELLGMVMLLLMAGHETTVHLISNCFLLLFQHPNVLAELKDDLSRCPDFVEESLRFASPVQYAKPRFVARDCEFFGQSLKRGEMVMPSLAAANYDPAVFDEPDQFKLDRKPNRHVEFGAGPHVCLGLKLARAETRIALEILLTKYPDLKPDFDPLRPDWSRRLGFRALRSLKILV